MTEQSNPKTWFITGASSGFGLTFVHFALQRGDRVVATARSPKKFGDLAEQHGDRLRILPLDVTSAAACAQAIDTAIKHFGQVDYLINNAGYGIVGALEETPEADLRLQMETHLFGPVALIKAVLPHMRQRQQGAIVNMSSLGGQLSFAGFSAYSASKFALEGMSEALAEEVAPFGIKVLIVEPGAFRTGFASEALKQMPEIDAYQSSVGGTRDFARGMHGTQAGDPEKAIAAIATALDAETTPLRLQLGQDAIDAVRGHAENLLADMTTWEAVALATQFDDVE